MPYADDTASQFLIALALQCCNECDATAGFCDGDASAERDGPGGEPANALIQFGRQEAAHASAGAAGVNNALCCGRTCRMRQTTQRRARVND